MDCPLPVASDDGDLSWSDRHSMDSDDEHSMILDQASGWIDAFSASCSSTSLTSTSTSTSSSSSSSTATSSTSNASHMAHAGQLSPISTSSTGMNMHMLSDNGICSSAATAPAMIHSASSSSSCADSWSMGIMDSDDLSATESNNDLHWEQGSDDVLTVPKLEPVDDDDFCLDEVKEAPMTPVPNNNAQTPAETKVKRPRGRPRKHPITPVLNTSKVTKGRSKTGCITCRKRKKKCDEAKPRCMNCEKNAVVCEGYPEKQIWKSGKERAEEALLKAQSLPVITMQPIFSGLETLEDRIFWKHYNDHLSAVLTVEGEHKNAFKEMLIPIATQHEGLMHSILALAGTHLDCTTPYGINLLKKYPGTSVCALQDRSNYHHEQAMGVLMSLNCEAADAGSDLALSATYGQILCLLLEQSAQGVSHGQHRFHLHGYQKLMSSSSPQDLGFLTFITEFFQYRIFADELIRYPARGHARLADQDWKPAQPIRPARLLGVADGLFNLLSQITTIRNNIRDNMASQADPIVDYTSLYQAAEIDEAIREWTPQWPLGDSRDRVGLLYKQMMWVYLFRTIYPPSPASMTSSATSSSASLLANPSRNANSNQSHHGGPSMVAAGSTSIVHTPPESPSTFGSASPMLRPNSAGAGPNNGLQPQHHPPLSPRRHSIAHPQSSVLFSSGSILALSPRANVGPDTPVTEPSVASTADNANDGNHTHHRAESPAPIRHPPHQDPRITVAVDESLAILESFKPSDPAQTLLLIPCLVIGAACFSPSQQGRVRTAVRTVRGYTGLRSTDRVAQLLEEVWRLMAEGDWAAVWDWQGVADRLGLDFLCS